MNLTLPSDTYTIVVHNDSRSEFLNVEFINTDKLSTFMVRSLEWAHPYYEPEDDEFVACEPEDIVSATVRGVEITGDVARYHYDKPDLAEYSSSEVVEVDMDASLEYFTYYSNNEIDTYEFVPEKSYTALTYFDFNTATYSDVQ